MNLERRNIIILKPREKFKLIFNATNFKMKLTKSITSSNIPNKMIKKIVKISLALLPASPHSVA